MELKPKIRQIPEKTKLQNILREKTLPYMYTYSVYPILHTQEYYSTLQRVKMDEGPIYQAEGYHWNHPFNSIACLLTGHKPAVNRRKRKLDRNS